MMASLDQLLGRITMYRLVLYFLIFLLVIASFFGQIGLMPYSPLSILISVIFLIVISVAANHLFSHVFEAPVNVESAYITALILALIIAPIKNSHDLAFLGWAGLLSMATKYIFAIDKKHLFNPAAIAVVLTSLFANQSAVWWVGTLPLSPFVLVGGYLIVHKIRRQDLVFSFFIVALLATTVLGVASGQKISQLIFRFVIDLPLLFFAFVMLTEPLTTPPTKKLRLLYGALVGFLFVPQLHFKSIYLTPEIVLIIGNIFVYLVSPKIKLILKLKERIRLSPDIYEFVFSVDKMFKFLPGQYLEWTLAHDKSDVRGNRRYFTIASSPTEVDLRMGVKFYPHSSSFKTSMLAMDQNSTIVASQLSGDFVLPKDRNIKCVFIAGGIGVTPFRSMIKYLIDTNDRRSITLFYANKTVDEIVYRDIFDAAESQLGIKTLYLLSDLEHIPQNWSGIAGRLDSAIISREVPDYLHTRFYLSGPHGMVEAYQEVLASMGVKHREVITDYFPGLT
jgi:ferredoxin-NADP reductase/Na+-translocating ferredoxin:NAD+ oxidoreductase RnfD subunit